MRVYIKLSKNDKKVPFNYQPLLTGVIHKWLGRDNKFHGKTNVFTFSWLQNTIASKEGIDLKEDAYFFISAHNPDFIRSIVKGILKDPEMFSGIRALDIQIQQTPSFQNEASFLLASPILLKEKEEDKTRHVIYKDKDFEKLLTESFKRKLKNAEIDANNVQVLINPDSTYRSTKLVDYNGIKNRTTLAPIIIRGTAEQIQYAWCVGLGNSTGIGFGALK